MMVLFSSPTSVLIQRLLFQPLYSCYETPNPTKQQFNFNYALIRTRRVVECAFGRLKKRFPILKNSRLFNPTFAANVATVLCALQNFIESTGDVYNPSDLNVNEFVASHVIGAAGLMQSGPDAASAYQVKDKLASYMTRVLDLDPVVGPSLPDVQDILNGPVGYVDR
mmetsp:Transcript_767/g.1792  ORF Transcript_767/g.1792 Transcript_767/m.1792 type:complete len:167 (+) Transcript_767:252-752(+)